MRKGIPIFAGVALVALAAVTLRSGDELSTGQHTTEIPAGDPPAVAANTAAMQTAPAPSLDRPEIENSLANETTRLEQRVDELIADGLVPPNFREFWLDPEFDRVANEAFYSIPRNLRVAGQTCDTLRVGEYEICWNEYGHHPYLAYAVADLKVMADTDAAAAEALSIMLPVGPERLHYTLQSARLSGKAGPVMGFAYIYKPSKRDPEYRDQLLDQYTIARMGESLGYHYRFSRELEPHILSELNITRRQLFDELRGRPLKLLEGWEG